MLDLGGRRQRLVLAGVGALVLLSGAVAVVVAGGGDDEPPADVALVADAGDAAPATAPDAPASTYELVPVTGAPVRPTTTSVAVASEASTTTSVRPTTTAAPSTTTAPPVVFSVSPSRDLPERAWVTLQGSGLFRATGSVGSWQCPTGVRGRTEIQARCDGVWVNQIDLDAEILEGGDLIETTRPVRRVLAGGDGTDCSVAPGCELLLHDGRDTVLAAMLLHFTGPSGPLLPMTVTATPTSELPDSAVVTVTAEHFHAGYRFQFSQCGRNGKEINGIVCGAAVEAVADVRGRLVVTLPVSAVVSHPQFGSVDCRVVTCFVNSGFGGVPEVPLTFRPTSPSS